MEIRRFKGKDIHGYLNPNVRFYRDITFLTGINGSGKTTIVHSIISLVSPSLRALASMNYKKMEVTVKSGKRSMVISAKRENDHVILKTSATDEELRYPIYQPEPDDFISREDIEGEYYESIESHYSEHPVISAVQSLPTPMFLNLERRAGGVGPRPRRRWRRRPLRRGRNIFSPYLMQSLLDAATLAEETYSHILIQQSKLSEDLRRQIMLDAFTVQPSVHRRFSISKPTGDEVRSIEHMKSTIGNISALLHIPEKEVSSRLGKFLEYLEQLVEKIPSDKSTRDILLSERADSEALIAWVANKPHFERIKEMIQDVSTHVKRNNEITSPIDEYLNLINNFLNDSGKSLAFDERGNIVVKLPSGETQDIYAVSSGEAQIVVIITHLTFNPEAHAANIFVIDEPELSLHVQWQEKFVDTLRKANPRIQLIMATHSPSIIMDRLNRCCDLTKEMV